jgi:hypothetical protein
MRNLQAVKSSVEQALALILESAQSAIVALTDEEIVAAWNDAGETRPGAGAADLYLHYMRAIAKAQRDKMRGSDR